MIPFLFRMCAYAPETAGESTEDRFREILRSGIEKGVDERQELLDFKFALQYGLIHERRDRLRSKLRKGERLTLPELREAIENEYLDDSFSFKPLDQEGLPENIDPKDTVSHNEYQR